MKIVLAFFAAMLVMTIGDALSAVRVEAPVECLDVAATRAKLEAQRQDIKLLKHLKGDEAKAVAYALKADFEASDILIYTTDDGFYVVALVGGCFRGVAGPIPLEVFYMMFPGLV